MPDGQGLFIIPGLVVMAFFGIMAWRWGYLGERKTRRSRTVDEVAESETQGPPPGPALSMKYGIQWPGGAFGSFGGDLDRARRVSRKYDNSGAIVESSDSGETWVPLSEAP